MLYLAGRARRHRAGRPVYAKPCDRHALRWFPGRRAWPGLTAAGFVAGSALPSCPSPNMIKVKAALTHNFLTFA